MVHSSLGLAAKVCRALDGKLGRWRVANVWENYGAIPGVVEVTVILHRPTARKYKGEGGRGVGHGRGSRRPRGEVV